MRRPVDHAALRAAGYFTQLGVETGTEARFHLSSSDPAAQCRVVRLDRAMPYESTGWPVTRTGAPLAVQRLELGSCLTILPPDALLPTVEWALELEIRLTDAPMDRVLIAGCGVTVRFAANGAVVLEGAASVTGQI